MGISSTSKQVRGRPDVTSHAAIERAAFELFESRGFSGTTMDSIAEKVGVGRRTLFRYFSSKNDIPWGQFENTIEYLRQLLADQPQEIPVHKIVHRAVLEFNRFPPDVDPPHRVRMRLILGTPELQAHSVLMYGAWRQVIAERVAHILGLSRGDLLPQTVGYVSLALSLAAYEAWLESPEQEPERDSEMLLELIDESMGELQRYLEL